MQTISGHKHIFFSCCSCSHSRVRVHVPVWDRARTRVHFLIFEYVIRWLLRSVMNLWTCCCMQSPFVEGGYIICSQTTSFSVHCAHKFTGWYGTLRKYRCILMDASALSSLIIATNCQFKCVRLHTWFSFCFAKVKSGK